MSSQATIPRPIPSRHHGASMTLAEYESLPEEKPYLEYWDGVVIRKAVPTRRHGKLEGRLVLVFDPYGTATGGEGWPEAHIWFEGRGYLVPDFAYWAPGKPQGDDHRSLPPTLAVEVRSPDQSFQEQRAKCRLMLANGVDVCWLLDPASRSIEAFEAGRDGDRKTGNDAMTSAFLPGFAVEVAAIFAVLDG